MVVVGTLPQGDYLVPSYMEQRTSHLECVMHFGQNKISTGLGFKIAQRGYPLLFGRFQQCTKNAISIDRLYDSAVFVDFGQKCNL